jgi:DNA-binding LacI/PurR family transcriptional regulator
MPPKKKAAATPQAPAVAPAESPRRVTLEDIARELGVTKAAVSLALRNQRVSQDLKRKVKAKAAALGYRPDPMLTALSFYRHAHVKTPVNTELAWINCWTDPRKLRSFKEFDLYWQGAYAEAENAGYRLEQFEFNGNLRPARLEQILSVRNIRGILLPPWHKNHPDWQDFPWHKFCTVRFGNSLQTPRVHIIGSDQLSNGLIACEKIRQLGYKSIGLVSGVLSHSRFAGGFLHHQMRHHAEIQINPLVLSHVNREDDKRILAGWIQQYQPDAIFTDLAQLRQLLLELGLRVPRDVGLAVYSVLDGDADAGIYQNSDEIGRAAVRQVISLIHHNGFGIPEVCNELLVEGRWVDGTSMPPKK